MFRMYAKVMMLMRLFRFLKKAGGGKSPTFNSLGGIALSFWDGLTNPRPNLVSKKRYGK